jgi:lipoprotein-anchoring transpeptidase ErfK/SrfK
MRVSRQRLFKAEFAGVSISNQRFWQIAILSAAGTIAVAPQADAAALFYWQDSEPGYYRPAPTVQPRKPRKPAASKAATKETTAKPQGPLIIAVSIEQQKVRVYDSNGLFAESPVSTGMKGHSTPMGVFSIIQKNKMHRSNIYSGAPMPYMQRITWSGIAMHAGALPGYPASHGCIRMPMAFAMKMWNWTRMGARVIITPGEISPATFSHPLLVTQKIAPQPLIADDPKTDAPAVKGDKGADAGPAISPVNSMLANAHASLDLRPTFGHTASLREQVHTADASTVMPAGNAAVTMSDAAPSGSNTPAAGDAPNPEAKVEAPKSESAEATAQLPAGGPSKADESAKTEKTEQSASEGMKAEDKPVEAKAEAAPEGTPETESTAKSGEAGAPAVDVAKTEPAKIDAPKVEETGAAQALATEKPVDAVATLPAPSPEVKKDTARLPGAEKVAAARRPGQIAVFVSRKDSKLYVRESFKPQFDVPVTIAPSDRPLGTHVFTAEADRNDPNLLRWSVVSLPVTARNAARIDDDGRSARRRKVAGGAPAEAKPLPAPNSAAEALDRISVPQDAIARIAEALTTGGSIVVSDHGIHQGGETGEGTDFIVPLR